MRRLALLGIVVVACAKDPAPKSVTVDAPSATSTGTAAPLVASATGTPSATSATSAPSSTAAPTATASAAPQIVGPPGPKGDGSCVARAMAGCTSPPCTKVLVPVPCPAMATAKSTDEELGRSACDWAAACERMGDEGCCVGCTNPFRVKLSRSCALQIVAKKDCRAVQSAWDACAGR